MQGNLPESAEGKEDLMGVGKGRESSSNPIFTNKSNKIKNISNRKE